jgi:hypothetical protein
MFGGDGRNRCRLFTNTTPAIYMQASTVDDIVKFATNMLTCEKERERCASTMEVKLYLQRMQCFTHCASCL